ncbi:MAG: VOC family protein [Gaiellaceae bacterium]
MTQVAPETTRLAPETRLGGVELTVTDLDHSVPFYEDAIGLRLARRDEHSAALGAGDEDLLVLVEDPDARPAGRHAGLYHFALLHPSRLELARAAARLAATKTPISGASDHGISEAIYLSDPDGNGIELAADRPRESWPDLSVMAGGPEPLDLNELLELVAGEEPRLHIDPATSVGHIHLHIGDLEAALRFYRDVVGFDVMTYLPSAVFVAAGGYHHHVGFNTWRGPGVPPAPDGVVGLRHFSVVLRDEPELEALRARAEGAGVPVEETLEGALLRDPAGNALLFRLP